MNVQVVFNPPSTAVIGVTPQHPISSTGGLPQPSTVTPAVSSPSASPTANAEATTSTPKKYRCPMCGKMFDRSSGLKNHNNSHTGERPFACTYEGGQLSPLN
ncbi:hypothetical protein RUND412_002832 [Rhizina undulata]